MSSLIQNGSDPWAPVRERKLTCMEFSSGAVLIPSISLAGKAREAVAVKRSVPEGLSRRRTA